MIVTSFLATTACAYLKKWSTSFNLSMNDRYEITRSRNKRK